MAEFHLDTATCPSAPHMRYKAGYDARYERDVGNSAPSGNEPLALREYAVKHAENAQNLIHVALYRAGNLLGVTVYEPSSLAIVRAVNIQDASARTVIEEGMVRTPGQTPGRRAIAAVELARRRPRRRCVARCRISRRGIR